MKVYLSAGFQADMTFSLSREGHGLYSLLGDGPGHAAADLHVAGLSAAQLHQLAQEILAKVPLPVAPPAPETETDPFADTATVLAGQ